MVNEGVATTAEIDDAIRFGCGIRWSFMGTFLIYTLAGGDAGMKHFMAQFGPALELPWTKLKAPQLTDELIDRVVEGTDQQKGSSSIKRAGALSRRLPSSACSTRSRAPSSATACARTSKGHE